MNAFHDYPVSENEYFLKIDSESRRKIEQIMVKYAGRSGIPGASLAVARDGEILYANGFGWDNLETEEKTHYRSIFRVGHVSKAITLAGILHLVDDGALSLEDFVFGEKLLGKIIHFNFTNTNLILILKSLTVRHLLDHSSGFSVKWLSENNMNIYHSAYITVT